MIKFLREGTKVKIEIEGGVLGYSFTHNHECGQDHFAYLLRESYANHMKNKLEEIRRQAYEKGWKDAKAKAKKETWFSGWW